jgi:hypothetical protein
VGRDTPEELGLPETLGLADHEAQLLAALFPKARPRF